MFLKEFTNRLYRNKTHLFDIFLICLIGTLAISWFRGDFLINGGTFGLPLDRAKYFYATISIWDSTALGYNSPRQLPGLMPYSFFSIFTSIIGLSVSSYEKLLFYLVVP